MELLLIIGLIVYIIKQNPKAKPRKRNIKVRKNQNQWQSEWKWDENSQTWVHPLSEKPNPKVDKEKGSSEPATEPEIAIDFANAYQAQPIFTKNEWQNYKTLRDVAAVKGYIICPKVRLLDIVKPRSGEKKYKTLLYKIQSKHVDFVICDQNMTIKAIIELDDKTHDTEKGKERDAFVDTVLRSVGYKVIHVRYINHDILDLV